MVKLQALLIVTKWPTEKFDRFFSSRELKVCFECDSVFWWSSIAILVPAPRPLLLLPAIGYWPPLALLLLPTTSLPTLNIDPLLHYYYYTNTQPHNTLRRPPNTQNRKRNQNLGHLILWELPKNNMYSGYVYTSQFLRCTRQHLALSMKLGYNLTHSILWKEEKT